MDGTRFDALTRTLVSAGSRRRFVGGLLASAIGLVASRDADAASCRGVGEICREDANCCSGNCGDPDRRGRRYCNCTDVDDCPTAPVCRTVACIEGACVTSVTPGAACTSSASGPGTCQGTICVPNTTSSTTSTSTTSTSTSTTSTSTTSTSTSTTTTTFVCVPRGETCSSNEQCCNPADYCDIFGDNTCKLNS